MNLRLLAWALVLLGLQAAPPPEPGRFLVRSKAGFPAAMDPKLLVAGLPVLQVQVDYVGPKTWLWVDAQCWQQGKFLRMAENHHEVRLPLSGAVGIGFGEGKTNDG